MEFMYMCICHLYVSVHTRMHVCVWKGERQERLSVGSQDACVKDRGPSQMSVLTSRPLETGSLVDWCICRDGRCEFPGTYSSLSLMPGRKSWGYRCVILSGFYGFWSSELRPSSWYDKRFIYQTFPQPKGTLKWHGPLATQTWWLGPFPSLVPLKRRSYLFCFCSTSNKQTLK